MAGPFPEESGCRGCRNEELRLDGVVVAYAYRGTARRLVLALKYHARFGAADLLATAMAEALRDDPRGGDLLVPVPLSAARRRERGFNQAEWLGRRVARELDLDFDPRALIRRRHTPPQVGLTRRGRLRSPRGAFLASRRRVEGRDVLLLDDVLTTGGTARAAAVALRRAGARRVLLVVAGRAEGQ